MPHKVLSVQYIPSEISREDVRDIVSPPKASYKACIGILREHGPPVLRDVQTGLALDLPLSTPAVGMAFRPTSATEINGERNFEVAIAYGVNAQVVEFYDVALDAWLEPLRFPRVQSVTYNHQGDKFALGNASGYVVAFDLAGGKKRRQLCSVKISKSAVVRLAFTATGESVMALTASGAIYSVELSTGEVEEVIFSRGESFDCWAHALHSQARLAAFAGSAGSRGKCLVRLCSLDDGRVRTFETSHKIYVRRLQFVGDDQLVVIGDQGVEVFDLVSCKRSFDEKPAGKAYTAIQAGPCAYVLVR